MTEPKQKLSRLLAGYKPRPGPQFYQQMDKAPWNQKESKMINRPSRPLLRAWQAALAAVLVLAVLSLGIPSVRAALSAWLGLSVAPSNQAPAPAVTLVAFPSPTPGATVQPTAAGVLPSVTAVTTEAAGPSIPAANRPAEVVQMSVQAGWDVLAAGALPQGYQFQSAYFDANHQMAILTYLATKPLPGAKDPSLTASHTITLLQALKNDFVPLQVAPSARVVDIQVSGQPGAYVVGAWDSQFVPDAKDPQGGQMVSTWRNDLPVQNVYWQVGQVYLALVTDDAGVSQAELIDMANGVGK